jgi:CoA:oxalate CoA-transferase
MMALDGVRVLELSHYIAGPHCGLVLADHGADVLKVEPPSGDASRRAEPFHDGESLYFSVMNRNKRSLVLDLKRDGARGVFEQMVREVDVVVTNYAAGVPERLGVGYEQLRAVNPRIIVVQITGFGATGPLSGVAAFDGIVQAMSGVSHLTGERDGHPLKAGVYVADHAAALQGAIGALSALRYRDLTGEGQLVDISMLDSMVSMLAWEPARATLGMAPLRNGNRSVNVFASTFPAADGYVYLAPLSDDMWNAVVDVVGDPALAHPDYASMRGRLDHYARVEELLTRWTRSTPAATIVDLLRARRVACGVVSTVEDVVASAQVRERATLVDIPHGDGTIPGPARVAHASGMPRPDVQAAPPLGAHTISALETFGFPEQEIARLLAEGVVHDGERSTAVPV